MSARRCDMQQTVLLPCLREVPVQFGLRLFLISPGFQLRLRFLKLRSAECCVLASLGQLSGGLFQFAGLTMQLPQAPENRTCSRVTGLPGF